MRFDFVVVFLLIDGHARKITLHINGVGNESKKNFDWKICSDPFKCVVLFRKRSKGEEYHYKKKKKN